MASIIEGKRIFVLIAPWMGVSPSLSPWTGMLTEYLHAQSIECRVLDCRPNRSIEDVKKEIAEYDPALVYVSLGDHAVQSVGASDTCAFVNALDIEPARLVVGGAPVVLSGRQISEEIRARYFVVGDAEEALEALIRGRASETVPGLVDASVKPMAFAKPHFFDLKKIDFPRHRGIDLARFPVDEIPILTSAGCHHACEFCYHPVIWGARYRQRDPETVAAELEYWHERGYRRFVIQDDNFGFSAQRIKKLADAIAGRNLVGLAIRVANMRVDDFRADTARDMKRMGVTRVAFGVDVTNDAISQRAKGYSSASSESALALAGSLGFEIAIYLTIGLPGQRLRDVLESFALVVRYPIRTVSFHSVVPIEGTSLFTALSPASFLDAFDSLFTMKRYDEVHHLPMFKTPEMGEQKRRLALAAAGFVARYTPSVWKLRRRFSKSAP